MAEYIEREAVEKMLEDAQIITDGEYCGYCTEDVDVSQLPAADVVEVVRCKDCKHGEVDDPDDFPDLHYCHEGCGWNDADFYCKSGERRDNDATD